MSRQGFFRFTGRIALVILSGLLGACDHKAELERQSATPSTVTAPADSAEPDVTIDSGDRSFEITDKVQPWPSEMPIEVPRFEAGTIRKIIRTETPEGRSWDMAIDGVPPNAVKAFVAMLKEEGFETSSLIVPEKEGERGSVTGLKGELTVVLIASGGNASLSVILKESR
ncbi:MAG TPA: hypothetical protein ENL07_02535 [Chlorobaculum parvum]|uniref:Lipoprotein n=1 Tax=Chlorobaculum parvum TaxID=274539 RepID=A0A7C5DDB3_9CHLB|nr:hypothetical protein [Chlorobaculum parvum]